MLKRTLISACTAAFIGLSGAAALAGGHNEKPEASPWTNFTLQNTLNKMPAGNAANGEKVNQQWMCLACHGETGKSPSRNYPSLNGMPEEYTIKQMLDYRDGRRWENYRQANIMVKLAQSMTDQEIADMAAYYAKQPLTNWTDNAPVDPKIDFLVRKGDVNRMITPCASCHGVHGEGNGVVPSLAGQVPEYFVRTMKAYQDGQRHNDVNQGMSQFAHDLTDEEIQGLADYYAAMPAVKE